MRTELLAPAKNKETAFAAIDCGADAVYIGAMSYGARHNASNSLEDIKEVVDYAHKFWVKVYVTVNTILTDSELQVAVELVKQLEQIGVDAIIIQDMGLLEELMRLKTKIPLHISTQCDNRNSEKVSFFNQIGVPRIVLARELSLEQIKEIHEQNPDIQIETFVHGALCVSYSGQCYLSQYIGKRSANRGECAQPCRKKYSVMTEDGELIAKDVYALCLKDFNASKHLKAMIDAGVYSFKIEGRLKDTGYVKNITAYYRQKLDKISQKSSSGRSVYPFVPNPKKSFNRGFTDYFLEKRKDCFNFVSPKSQGEFIGVVKEVRKDCFSLNSSKEIHSQDGLMYGVEGFLVNKCEKGFVYPNKEIKISAGTKIFRNYDSVYEKELLKPVKRQIGLNVEVSNKIILKDEDGVEVQINIPSAEEAQNKQKMNYNFEKQFSKTGDSDFYINEIKIINDVPFMPVSQINQLRRDCFDKLMQKRLDSYKKEVQNSLKHCEFYKKELDYRANVMNKSAEKFYKNCECDVIEYALEKKLPNREIELMRTKHCIKYALEMCKSPKKLVLVDEQGERYSLKFDCKKCEMVVCSRKPDKLI